MPAHYFLGNRHLATGSAMWWSDTQRLVEGLAFFCPTCGEIWARITSDSNEPGSHRWASAIRTCERCGLKEEFPIGTPGSFIHPWLNHIANLPHEVLFYEVQLRLKRYPE